MQMSSAEGRSCRLSHVPQGVPISATSATVSDGGSYAVRLPLTTIVLARRFATETKGRSHTAEFVAFAR